MEEIAERARKRMNESEKAADAYVFECPKYSGYDAHVETFLAGVKWQAERMAPLVGALKEIDGYGDAIGICISEGCTTSQWMGQVENIVEIARKALATLRGSGRGEGWK